MYDLFLLHDWNHSGLICVGWVICLYWSCYPKFIKELLCWSAILIARFSCNFKAIEFLYAPGYQLLFSHVADTFLKRVCCLVSLPCVYKYMCILIYKWKTVNNNITYLYGGPRPIQPNSFVLQSKFLCNFSIKSLQFNKTLDQSPHVVTVFKIVIVWVCCVYCHLMG